jgi:flagellin-like hook-associated protein FlgL
MADNIVINSALRNTLTSIKQSERANANTSNNIATGKRVNRAIDQPQNFFASNALLHMANDYSKLLDKMSLGIRTIQEAMAGVEAIENILNLAEVKALEAKEELEKTSSALPNTILDDAPVGYFRLNDADGTTATNLGTLGAGGDGTYTNGVIQGEEILFYGAGGLPARFNGVDQFIAVPNDNSINLGGPFPERTVELIFNADTTAGRQVLWEEGGAVNNLNIYIDDGLLRVNGRTTNAGGYGPLDISVPIESGVTYHVAFTQDGPGGRFTGYLNGEQFGSAAIGAFIGHHPNENGIGAVNQNIYYHDDGPGNAPNRPDGTHPFQGQISDVAIYNSIISADGMRQRYEATSLGLSESYRQEILEFLQQIEDIGEDSNFRGLNLLAGEDLIVDFNDEKTSKLKVDGQDFSIESLGLTDVQFQKPSQVETAISSIRKAIAEVRDFGSTLATDLSIVNIRQDFTRNFIVNKKAGASDLTIADLNEEGARQLAGQTRQELGYVALSLAAQSQSTVLEIFGTQSDLFLS